MVEQGTCNAQVRGSNPRGGSLQTMSRTCQREQGKGFSLRFPVRRGRLRGAALPLRSEFQGATGPRFKSARWLYRQRWFSTFVSSSGYSRFMKCSVREKNRQKGGCPAAEENLADLKSHSDYVPSRDNADHFAGFNNRHSSEMVARYRQNY